MRLGIRMALGMALSAAAMGCNSTCNNLSTEAQRCGQAFDGSTCNSAMSSCSNTDQTTLNNVADCEQSSSVCNNGQVVDAIGFIKCSAPEAGISNACAEAFANN